VNAIKLLFNDAKGASCCEKKGNNGSAFQCVTCRVYGGFDCGISVVYCHRKIAGYFILGWCEIAGSFISLVLIVSHLLTHHIIMQLIEHI
jgi:hypothetical protein